MFKISDNTEQNSTTIALFKRAIKLAGLDLPAFDPATVPAPSFTPATAADVADAAYKAATAGKDPSTDKEVQRLLMSKLLADQIGGLHYRHEIARSRAELEHYRAEAPALLEELEERFQDAVEAMTEQIPIIGHVSLDDSMREIGNMPDRKAAAVATAHAANSRTARLIEALPYLMAAANGGTTPGGKYALLSYIKPSLQQFNHHMLSGQSTMNNHRRKHNVWDLLNDGITVELATTSGEVQERISRLERDGEEMNHDRRAEAAQHAEAKAQAKAMGF